MQVLGLMYLARRPAGKYRMVTYGSNLLGGLQVLLPHAAQELLLDAADGRHVHTESPKFATAKLVDMYN